jgi:hypothetical protein
MFRVTIDAVLPNRGCPGRPDHLLEQNPQGVIGLPHLPPRRIRLLGQEAQKLGDVTGGGFFEPPRLQFPDEPQASPLIPYSLHSENAASDSFDRIHGIHRILVTKSR